MYGLPVMDPDSSGYKGFSIRSSFEELVTLLTESSVEL